MRLEDMSGKRADYGTVKGRMEALQGHGSALI
jgi:hypothetical protein